MIFNPAVVSKDRIEAIVELLDIAFEHTPAEYFRRKLMENDTTTIAISDDDMPVATVTMYDREVWYHGRKFRMCGIGDVATHPEYRGKGLASKLMRHAVEMMKKEGYDLSILFTDINSYYEKFGYSTVVRKVSRIEIPEPKNSGNRVLHLNNIDEAAPHVEGMLALYEPMASKYDYSIVRTKAYFLRTLKWFYDDGGKGIVVFDGDGKLLAYGFYRMISENKAVFYDAGGDMNALIHSIDFATEANFPIPHHDIDVESNLVHPLEDKGMMALWMKEGRETDEKPFFSWIDSF